MNDPQGVLEEFVAAAALGHERFIGEHLGMRLLGRKERHPKGQAWRGRAIQDSNGDHYDSIQEAGRVLAISYKAIERVLYGRKPTARATRGLGFTWA